MQLVWRPLALADRQAIMDYIAKNNPRAAVMLDDEFQAKAQLACRHPERYRLGRMPNTRELVVRPHYVMIYRVSSNPDTVMVLRVLHTAQQWPSFT